MSKLKKECSTEEWEKIRQKKRKWSRAWAERNPTKILLAYLKHSQRNKLKIKELKKAWVSRNKEKVKASKKKYYNKTKEKITDQYLSMLLHMPVDMVRKFPELAEAKKEEILIKRKLQSYAQESKQHEASS
jgi:hypothetical protein